MRGFSKICFNDLLSDVFKDCGKSISLNFDKNQHCSLRGKDVCKKNCCIYVNKYKQAMA